MIAARPEWPAAVLSARRSATFGELAPARDDGVIAAYPKSLGRVAEMEARLRAENFADVYETKPSIAGCEATECFVRRVFLGVIRNSERWGGRPRCRSDRLQTDRWSSGLDIAQHDPIISSRKGAVLNGLSNMVFGHGSFGRTIPADLAKEPSAPHVGSGEPDIHESDGLHNRIVQHGEEVSAGGPAAAPTAERNLQSVAVPRYLLHREPRELKHPEGACNPQGEQRTIPSALK
jgi:hypothetical protein